MKLVVVACNRRRRRSRAPDRAARPRCRRDRAGGARRRAGDAQPPIGLLATQATVASGRYEELVRALDAGADVLSVACPRLVPLIEGDDPFAEETSAACEYAAPLKAAGVDTVILGCTHYPLIRPILQRVFGRDVTLVFSADETAREVAETPRGSGSRTTPRARAPTASRPATRTRSAMGRRFLQLPIEAVEHVEIAALEAAA